MGSSWLLLALPGSSWLSSWLLLAPPWLPLAPPGSFWIHLAFPGCPPGSPPGSFLGPPWVLLALLLALLLVPPWVLLAPPGSPPGSSLALLLGPWFFQAPPGFSRIMAFAYGRLVQGLPL
jgi:hypothetical protein